MKYCLLFVLLILNSCVDQKGKGVLYKKSTGDILLYENKTIKDKSAKTLFNEGLDNVRSGKFESAKQKFVDADKIESNNPTILNAIAQAESRLGNLEKANLMTFEILTIDSTYTETYINLSAIYMSEKNYAKARDILLIGTKFTTDKDPRTKAMLLINLAVAYNNLDDYKNGLKSSSEAMKISPDKELTEFANQINWESAQNIKN